MSSDKVAATHHPHTPPAEYLITIRVRTNREPRDDPFPHLVKAAEAMFKVRPTGTLDLIGATVEQVPTTIPGVKP